MSRFRIFLLLYVLILAAIILAWFISYRPIQLGGDTGYFVVLTSSMIPTIYPGDLVLTKPSSMYHVGDIVAYVSPKGVIIIHRIIRVVSPGCFITKGDNAPAPDPWIVCKREIIGKVVMRIPLIGTLIEEAHRSPIVLALVVTIASLIVFSPVAIAYALSSRKNYNNVLRYQVTSYKIGNNIDKKVIMIGVALSALCVVLLLSYLVHVLSIPAYRIENEKIPTGYILVGTNYEVLLKNNTLYKSTILDNPAFTYIKILRSIIVKPYIKYFTNSTNIEEIRLNCSMNVVLVEERTYGWRKILFQGPCNSVLVLNFSKIQRLAYRISEETNVYSDKYGIDILFNIAVSHMSKNGFVEDFFRRECMIDINYIYDIVSFEDCNSKIILYERVQKFVPNIISTPFGYFTKNRLVTILTSMLIVPLVSMVLMVYFYFKDSRLTSSDPVKSILERYRDIIIKTSERPKVSGKEVVRVLDVEDLLKLSKLLSKPIFYTAVATSRGRFHIFYIDADDKIYIHMLAY